MIDQPATPNGYQHHSVSDTLIDPQNGLFYITVGSWMDGSFQSKPIATKELCVQVDAWQPDYFGIVEQIVNEHPDWSGGTPVRPNKYCVLHWPSKQWIDPRTLDDIKAQQWAAIKAARTAAETGGFTWDGSVFDSDSISQSRIMGAVQLAQMNSNFTIDWTLADNTVRTLSALDMLAVGIALGNHVGAQFTKGQALRAQIEAATTSEAVEAIVW